MNIDITLAEALERASEGLRKKMLHSVELLQKAEKIALNYDASQKHQRIAQDAGGYIKHQAPEHWRPNRGVWNIAAPGFSSSSSSDRLTEEQETEIAENIYDWWISGKSYKQWYAEKFQQMKLDFGES